MKRIIIAATLFATVAALAGEVRAAAFSAWQVANVPWGDTLSVRKYPASHSQKQSAYPNGAVLQMTGKCTDGINLFDISGQSDWSQKQAVRYSWCEVWHDPKHNGDFVTGWVYGKYIRPH
jgi:hypothetical protein